MGCAPSKNTSNVHPTGLSNDSIVPPEQELPDPPTSSPEPAETNEQLFEPSLSTTMAEIKLQGHDVSKSSDSSWRSTKPKLQRQSTITGDEDIQPNTDETDFEANNSNVENSYFYSLTDHLSNQFTSDQSNEQCSRPSWAIERACLRSNPTLRLYGTDSQIEFFKMLDKKIQEGPDFHEESGTYETT